MRKRLAVLVLLLLAVILLPLQVVGQGGLPTPETDVPDAPMVVLYLTPSEVYLQSFVYRSDMSLREYENKLYLNGEPVINDLTKASWRFYKYKPIEPKLEWSEELQELAEVPQTLSELNLQPLSPNDLPKSQHIARVQSINPSLARPVTVTRRWMGQNYDVRCLITQDIKDMWVEGKVGVGDYVIVSFIDEHPNETEINMAIVTDRVFVSWD